MYERILVAVDGSDTSSKGLDEAVELARLARATLCLVHVIEITDHVTGFEPCEVFYNDALPAMERAGNRILQRAADRAASHGVEVQTRLLKNLAARTSELIVAEAVAWRAELIVTGTHGRRGFDRLAQGSTAEDVLRRSPVPVLVVRAASPGAQAVPERPAVEPAEAGAT